MSSFDTSWDVSKYRSPYEPNYQWELRRKFLELNKDRFPEERLVCLAQTFANIEFLGCRYPKATMDLVEELSFGVVQEHREKQKNILQRTFVSGSEAAGAKVNRRGPQRRPESSLVSTVSSANLKYGRFVKASATSDKEETQSQNIEIKESPQIISPNRNKTEVSSTSQNPSAVQINQAENCTTPEKDNSKRKKIVWDLEDVSQTKKPKPQHQEQLQRPHQQHQQRPQHQQHQQIPQQHQQQRQHPQSKRNNRNNVQFSNSDFDDPLSDFVIMRMADKPDEPANNVLGRSAGLCRMIQKTNYTTLNNGKTKCDVIINNEIVATSINDVRNDARDEAQHLALQNLSHRCYTIVIKNKYVSDGGTTIDVDSLDNAEQADDSLTSSNVGHKLLQMMGWSGGGLGKEGGGISEPITAQAVFNRQGLGTSTSDRDFKEKIRKIIEEYGQTNSPYDLVFSSGFTNEQRKEMHEISRRLGLKSKSFGKKTDRFITISRRFSGKDIIRQLLAKGGSNEKYELVSPNSN